MREGEGEGRERMALKEKFDLLALLDYLISSLSLLLRFDPNI